MVTYGINLAVLVFRFFLAFERRFQVVDKVDVAPSNELYLNHLFVSSVPLLENKSPVKVSCIEKILYINSTKYSLDLHVFLSFVIGMITNIFTL